MPIKGLSSVFDEHWLTMELAAHNLSPVDPTVAASILEIPRSLQISRSQLQNLFLGGLLLWSGDRGDSIFDNCWHHRKSYPDMSSVQCKEEKGPD